MTVHRTPLIVPSETQIREFDAKLLLACVAAERGFPVIVGSRIAIHLAMDRLPRAIYLAKDVKRSSRRMFDILRDLGHHIVAWEEEGAVVASPEHYWDTRIDRKALRRVCAQMTWGDEEAEIVARYPHHPGVPIHVTGNPRIDLLRRELRGFFDEEVEAIRGRYDRPILINTNFGTLNPYFPRLVKYTSGIRAQKNPDALFQNRGFRRHRLEVFEHFKKLVPALAAEFPDTQIVVRPHPGESHEVWHKAAANRENVHVLFEGSVTPWLLACSVLIHNGCMTAVEAAVQEVPTVSYRPISKDVFERNLPNALSRSAFSLDELFDALRPVATGDYDPAEYLAVANANKHALLRHHIAALDGPLASERIADALEEIEVTLRTAPRPAIATALGARIHTHLRAAGKRVSSLIPGSKNDARYTRHRFPGISLDEIHERIARLGRALGRFGEVRATALARDIFELRA